MRPLAVNSKIHTPVNKVIIASSLPPVYLLIRQLPRSTPLYTTHSRYNKLQYRNFAASSYLKMSQKPFSNTDVPGDKPADPYTAINKSNPDLKEKVDDLVSFIDSCKFGMMTTRIGSSGLLTSRCMALAAKVIILIYLPSEPLMASDIWRANHNIPSGRRWCRSTFPYQH